MEENSEREENSVRIFYFLNFINFFFFLFSEEKKIFFYKKKKIF